MHFLNFILVQVIDGFATVDTMNKYGTQSGKSRITFSIEKSGEIKEKAEE